MSPIRKKQDKRGAPKRRLLDGVRIVDLSTVLAGPYCTMLLADLGAEVIKIENPNGGQYAGDFFRLPTQYHYGGIAAYFLAINRSKKSMAIDLTREEGRRIFHDLVRVSDVVFDNSRPTALAKLGADYKTLKKVKPDIICCSLSGYGKTGPDSDKPAYDITIQARGGSMSLTGEPGRPPVRMGLAMGDLAGSLFSAIGILAALFSRERSAKGAMVDVALLDCQISLLTYLSEYYLIGGLVAGPQGSGHETLVPYRAYRAKDDYFTLACFHDKHWQAACRAMGREDLTTDPRYATGPARNANKDALNRKLERIFLTRTVSQWGRLFEAHEVPWGPINTIDRALTDRQVLARNMVTKVRHAVRGSYRSVGNPIKVSDSAEAFDPVPLCGQHTREIMEQVLGYRSALVDGLFNSGVVGEQTARDLKALCRELRTQSKRSQTSEKPGPGTRASGRRRIKKRVGVNSGNRKTRGRS